MKKPILIFALIVFLTSAACGLPLRTRWTDLPTLVPTVNTHLVNLSPTDIVASATPPVATQTAEAVGDVPAEPIAAPNQRTMPEGVVNIMVLGSDWRASSGHRTDVIMLFSVNTAKQSVSVISFPRDLYVPIPGWTTQRINTAEPHGGFDLLADTMQQNFSVRPEYYVMTDFDGFKAIVDSLGGVDVYAGSKLVDRCDLPIGENGICTILPGRHSMDGTTALWYIRSRYSSSDLDRLRREQEVMSGIFIRLMSGSVVTDLPGFFARYNSTVKTNLNIQALAPLLPTAARVFGDRELIHRYALTVKEAKPFVTDTGAQVLLPDYDRIYQILDEAIFNP
jgi:polyisoprenyl-teichoic acid--peptidoglycan teichoic acid transferase